jgi:peptidyl-tRNA hydrolase
MATDTKDTTLTGQAFDEFLEGQLADPSFKAGFEKKLAKVKSIAEVLQVIELVREREHPQGRARQTHGTQAGGDLATLTRRGR